MDTNNHIPNYNTGNYNPSNFLENKATKLLIASSAALSLVYAYVIAFKFPVSNPWLFGLLMLTQVFQLLQAFGFWYTVWDTNYRHERAADFMPAVDVFIAVCGEPISVVEQTVAAALRMDYPRHTVYVLNDGYVAKKDNWQEIEAMAHRLGVACITRTVPGGAKSGNINNGLRASTNPLVAMFDADHVPHRDFLKKTVGYFFDPKVGFVQSPQYYKNNSVNYIAGAAWEQQELFFGPLCKGKNRMNSAFMCGTNMVVRRSALNQVGGMNETNIAEDFLTSLFIHSNGWKSVYVPEILAEGLAPEDFLSYYKQQYRWARGSLEVIFKYNPLFMKGLDWRQKFQYLQGAGYYLTGFAVLINCLFPLIYFFTGQTPFTVSTMVLAAIFLPYIFLTLAVLSLSSNYSFTSRAIAFSIGSFILQIQATLAVIFNIKQAFAVTSKTAVRGNFAKLVLPQILYLVLTVAGLGYAALREGLTASLISNAAWAIFYSIIFSMFIVAALPNGAKEDVREISPARPVAATAAVAIKPRQPQSQRRILTRS